MKPPTSIPLVVMMLAVSGLGLLSCAEVDPAPRLQRVEVPLDVTWHWEDDDGSRARLVVEITPLVATASVSVEVNGPDSVALTPAGERTFTQVAARATVIHEVHCSGWDTSGDGACLDLLVGSRVEGLVMGRSLKVPLPGSSAEGGPLPPAPGEFVEDDEGQRLRVLPAAQKTTDRQSGRALERRRVQSPSTLQK